MKLHEMVKNIRLYLGLSQKELSDKLFISQNTISQYENGKRQVPSEVIEKLLDMSQLIIKLEKTINVSPYFQAFSSLGEMFPKWRVFHSGGGVWLLEKDIYSETLNKNVYVILSDESMVIFEKATDEFKDRMTNQIYDRKDPYSYTLNDLTKVASKDDYLSDEDTYMEYADMLNIVLTDELANELFSKDIVEDLKYIQNQLINWYNFKH